MKLNNLTITPKLGILVGAARPEPFARVPRMLRNAISAFTRVFDALCLSGVMRC